MSLSPLLHRLSAHGGESHQLFGAKLTSVLGEDSALAVDPAQQRHRQRILVANGTRRCALTLLSIAPTTARPCPLSCSCAKPVCGIGEAGRTAFHEGLLANGADPGSLDFHPDRPLQDRKSTRLNSSHS